MLAAQDKGNVSIARVVIEREKDLSFWGHKCRPRRMFFQIFRPDDLTLKDLRMIFQRDAMLVSSKLDCEEMAIDNVNEESTGSGVFGSGNHV